MNMMMQGSARKYASKVLRTQYASLVGYWTQGEASGTTAIDRSSQANNGTYTAVTLGQPGYPAGGTAALYDGATSVCNIYSAALNADVNKAEGSISLWCKINEDWSVTTLRYLVRLYSAGGNQIRIYKNNANRITLDYTAGSVTKSYEITTSNTGWFHLGITWSASNDRVRIYLDGVQVGADLTGLGTWSGNFTSSATVIGASATSASSAWIGWISNVAIWATELTPAEMGFVGYG